MIRSGLIFLVSLFVVLSASANGSDSFRTLVEPIDSTFLNPVEMKFDSIAIKADTVHKWIKMTYTSDKLRSKIKNKTTLFLSELDSIRYFINKEGDGTTLRFRVESEGVIISDEQTIEKSGTHGPFYLPSKVGPGPITFVLRKPHFEPDSYTLSFEKHFSYTHTLSVTHTKVTPLEDATVADTVATVLYENTLSIGPKEYGGVKVKLIDLSAIEGEFEYWMFYIGYGDQVKPVLAEFALQNPLSSGDAIQDYGLKRVDFLPEHPGKLSSYIFSNKPISKKKLLPDAAVSPNRPPSNLNSDFHKKYFGVVDSYALPKFLYLLNYEPFRRQLVYVKIVGFNSVGP